MNLLCLCYDAYTKCNHRSRTGIFLIFLQVKQTHSTLYNINNGSVYNFQVFCLDHEARFEEILCLSIKGFLINRKIGLEGVKKNEGWAQDSKNHSHPTEGL